MLEPPPAGAMPVEAAPVVKPRVWHLFVLFLLAQLISIGLTVIAIRVVAGGGATDDLAAPERVKEIALSPAVLIMSIGAAIVAHTSLALLVGATSSRPFVLRLRLAAGRLPAGEVAVAVVSFLALSNTCDVLLHLLPGYAKGGISVLYGAVGHLAGSERWLMVVLTGVAAPVAEELFFRGALQTRFAERFGRAIGLLVASAAFGLSHLEPIHALFGFVAGLYLGWLSDLAGSCRAPMVAHAVNNTIGVSAAIWWASAATVLNEPFVAASSGVLVVVCTAWLWRRAGLRRSLKGVGPSMFRAPGS